MAQSLPPCEVLVVGLGPTGAGLAALLAQRGVRVAVVERSTAPVGEPRAVHLDAETMRLLQLVGLSSEELIANTINSHGMEYVEPSGAVIFNFEPFERPAVLGWSQDRMFHQPWLDRRMRGQLAESELVDLHLGRSVVSVQQTDDHLVATLDDGSTIAAGWAVGCDGAASTMRKSVGVQLEDLGYDRRWVVIDLLVHDGVELPHLVQQLCDPDRMGTFAPGTEQRCRIEFALKDDETNEQMTDPDVVWSMLDRWVSPEDAEIERVAVYRFHALLPDRFGVGRMLLAGDAAHQMPPFMGQGLCAGLRDAANLAWKLAAVIRDGADESLVATYEHERRAHVRDVIDLSVLSGRTIETISEALAEGRTPELPPTSEETGWSRLPRLRGGLVADDAEWPVGDQGPQGTVRVGARDVLLDELGGYRFVVIARDPVTGLSADDAVGTLALHEYDGGRALAELVLGDHHAVIWRPDRYVHAVAAGDEAVLRLVAEIRTLLGRGGR